MRPIHLAQLDKSRRVVVLTREAVRPYLRGVTVAPITSRIRGLSIEVPVGPENGLDQRSVINLDNIQTIDAQDLGRQIGWLTHDQEVHLADALWRAFDLWAD